MPKTPRAESKSADFLGVRLSREERQRLEEAARQNRQTKSDFVRDAVADRIDATLDDDNQPDR